MSSKARSIVEDGGDDKKSSPSIISRTYNWIATAFTITPAYGKVLYAYARQIGWFVVTTGMITLLPLVFEVRREAALEEFEKAQITSGIQSGKTPQELASAGLTSAVEPPVL